MRVGSAQIHLTAVAIPCLLLSVLWSCAARQTSGTQRRPTQGDSEDGFQVCGVYLCGPFGMGSWQTLILYQDGNFRLIEAPHSCLGASYDELLARGEYLCNSGFVVLKTDYWARPASLAPATVFRAVQWGERVYLVDTARVAEFLEMTTDPDADCRWMQKYEFVRTDDQSKPLYGRPALVSNVVCPGKH